MTAAAAAARDVYAPLAGGGVEVCGTPFEYFVAERVFEDAQADALLTALERHDGWLLHHGDFFDQYEWNITGSELTEPIAAVLGAQALAHLRRQVERYLGCMLEPRVKVIAHRLVAGQGIGIHNDAPRGGDETHRLVVHLGRDYSDDLGGHLVFLDGPTADRIQRIFRPLHNSGVGFTMSDDSFHAVNTVRAGERYTLVFSFWGRSRPLARSVTVDRRLVADEGTATHLAYEAFPARAPTLAATTDGDAEWRFTLADSTTPGARLDQGLTATLASMCGVRPDTRGDYRLLRWLDDGRLFMRSLDHSWALWAWSLWRTTKRARDRPLIVHLDSHADLGSPPLACTERRGVFSLPLSDAVLDMEQSASVVAAIREGRIGIGSFVAPFLHTIGECDLHHVTDAEAGPFGASFLTLRTSRLPEPLVGERPSVEIRSEDPRGSVAGTYVRTELESLATLVPAGPVLLDVDMDYFCNRLDTSGAGGRGVASDAAGVAAAIDRLGRVLATNSALAAKVEVVSIALSPGFFPSEFWAESATRLEDAILDTLAAVPPARA